MRTPAAAGCWPSGARPRSSRRPRAPGRRTPPRARAGRGPAARPTTSARSAAGPPPELDSACSRARARTAWCIVGTAVYQVGSSSSSQSRNAAPRTPVRTDDAPAGESEASTAATSPWMWKSGITFRQRSPGPSASDRATFAGRHGKVLVSERDDLRARCRARRVEHERDVTARGRARNDRRTHARAGELDDTRRAVGIGAGFQNRKPVSFGSLPRGVTRGARDESPRAEVVQVEVELGAGIRRVQRRAGSDARRGEERGDRLGASRQHDCDPVGTAEAQSGERRSELADVLGEPCCSRAPAARARATRAPWATRPRRRRAATKPCPAAPLRVSRGPPLRCRSEPPSERTPPRIVVAPVQLGKPRGLSGSVGRHVAGVVQLLATARRLFEHLRRPGEPAGVRASDDDQKIGLLVPRVPEPPPDAGRNGGDVPRARGSPLAASSSP